MKYGLLAHKYIVSMELAKGNKTIREGVNMSNHMANLKKLRMERKLSQQKLADNFGITQQAIFNYENGINEPDIYMLKQFADFFHTSVDYVIGYTDNPVSQKDKAFLGNEEILSKELYHLSLYRKLSPTLQGYVDAILEEMTQKSPQQDQEK